MAEQTLTETIITLIRDEINRIPANQECTIHKIYENNTHTDVETENGIIKYVKTIGNNIAVGNTAILVNINRTENEYMVITK